MKTHPTNQTNNYARSRGAMRPLPASPAAPPTLTVPKGSPPGTTLLVPPHFTRNGRPMPPLWVYATKPGSRLHWKNIHRTVPLVISALEEDRDDVLLVVQRGREWQDTAELLRTMLYGIRSGDHDMISIDAMPDLPIILEELPPIDQTE